MTTLAIGSTSPLKIEALQAAQRKLGDTFELIPEDVASCVNAQPVGSVEAELGARNRARAAHALHPEAWALGIENGTMRSGEGWIDLAAIALIEPDGREWLIWSEAIALPTEDVEAAFARGPDVTVGSMIAERTGASPYDPHLFLTGRSRVDYLADAIAKLIRLVGLNRFTEKENAPMTASKTHRVQIGNVVRDLPLYQIPGGPRIALFNLETDVGVTDEAAHCLVGLQRAHGIRADAYIMPAGKATPLLQAIGRESKLPLYVAGKKKPYAAAWVEHTYISVTTKGPQTLYLSKEKADELRGKKVVIVDDVVSTGGTLDAIKALLEKIGAEVVAVMVVFTEGAPRNDVLSLGHLPLWTD